jgi:hypothetical protein
VSGQKYPLLIQAIYGAPWGEEAFMMVLAIGKYNAYIVTTEIP